MLAGKWTYRSYLNSADLVGGDPDKAASLIFGEGVFTLETPSDTAVQGNLYMGEGYVLDLNGTVTPAGAGPLTVSMAGTGRAGTATAGWEYDYFAFLAHEWPNGVRQIPALVGTVIRAKPHNGAPAGVTASFIAVKQD